MNATKALYKSFAVESPVNRSDLVEQLKDFGLTSYEAKAYVALAGLGPSEPKRIASESAIPYPSAYTALKTLESKGWAERVVDKPVTYRATKPMSIKTNISTRLEDAFGELQKIYRTKPTEEAELVYTIRGSDRVCEKIYEMIRGANTSVIVVSPPMGLEDPRIMELLSKAVDRGIRVRAICDVQGQGFLPPGVEIRTGNQVAFDLLVDDKIALIGLPDHSACGWVDSPAVTSHFKQFLELLWNTSAAS